MLRTYESPLQDLYIAFNFSLCLEQPRLVLLPLQSNLHFASPVIISHSLSFLTTQKFSTFLLCLSHWSFSSPDFWDTVLSWFPCHLTFHHEVLPLLIFETDVPQNVVIPYLPSLLCTHSSHGDLLWCTL